MYNLLLKLYVFLLTKVFKKGDVKQIVYSVMLAK